MGMLEDEAGKLLESRPPEEFGSGRPAASAGLGRRLGGMNKALQHLNKAKQVKAAAAPPPTPVPPTVEQLRGTIAPESIQPVVSTQSGHSIQPVVDSTTPPVKTEAAVSNSQPPVVSTQSGHNIQPVVYDTKPLFKAGAAVSRSEHPVVLMIQPVVQKTTGAEFAINSSVLSESPETPSGGSGQISIDNKPTKGLDEPIPQSGLDANEVDLSFSNKPSKLPLDFLPVAETQRAVSLEQPVVLSIQPVVSSKQPVSKDTPVVSTQSGHNIQPVVGGVVASKAEPSLNLESIKKESGKMSNQPDRPVVSNIQPVSVETTGLSLQEPVVVNPSYAPDLAGNPAVNNLPPPGPIAINFSDSLQMYSDSFIQAKEENFRMNHQKGEFMIPHELFQAIVVNIRSLYERDIYSCLLRWSLGFHRDWCEAGIAFISKWTGIQDRGNISRSLKKLITRGLIEIIEEPDYKANRGTVYKVPLVTNYLKAKGQVPEPYTPGFRKKAPAPGKQPLPQAKPTEETKDTTVVLDTTGCLPSHRLSDQQPTGGSIDNPPIVQNTTNKETNKEKPQTNSLSYPIDIDNYLSSIQAGGQRQSERDFLEKLLSDGVPGPVIAIALADLRKNGAKPKGDPIHMPMKYLWTNGQEPIARATRIFQSKSSSATAASEPIPLGHPKRSGFDQWRSTIPEAKVLDILSEAWSDHDAEQIAKWMQEYPHNVTCQLMSHFLLLVT